MRRSLVMLFLAVALFVSFIPRPAFAVRFTGGYLMQMCGVDKDGKEVAPGAHSACQSYISGVVDYHVLIRSLGTAPSVDFCIPKNVTLNDLQLIVETYLFKHEQEHRDFVAAPAVALALYEAFPCSSSK